MWQSPDPILGKYLPTGDRERDQNLPGMGGVFNSRNLAVFSYAALNPLAVVDPDGKANVVVGGADDCAKAGCSTWFSGPSKVYMFRNTMFKAANLTATKYDMFFTHHEATQPSSADGGQNNLLPSAAFLAIKKFHQENPNEPLDLFGHSWGGPTSLNLLAELTAAGIPVRSINTFDPVGGHARPEKPASSKALWRNFFPSWRNRSSGPDIVSGIGGEWNYTPGADVNYRVGASSSNQPSGHLGVLDPMPGTLILVTPKPTPNEKVD